MSGPTASVRAMPFSARAGLRVAGVLEEIHEDAKTTKPMVLLEDAEAALAAAHDERDRHLQRVIDEIGQQWDGCVFDAGSDGNIDIGEAIRTAGARLGKLQSATAPPQQREAGHAGDADSSDDTNLTEARAGELADALKLVQEMWNELDRRKLNPSLMRQYSGALRVLETDFKSRSALLSPAEGSDSTGATWRQRL